METSGKMESRGIVLLAGGPIYFLNGFISCAMLRKLGCTLPIEWFHLDELSQPQIDEIVSLGNIRVINLGGEKKNNTKFRGGWQNKVTSILESSFEEILFLDADCWVLKNPEYVFDHPFFQETGCVLFPDPILWAPHELAFLNEKYSIQLPERQVESGQMMFRKSVCLAGLLKTKILNENSDETYRYVFGDKDTFLIGMLQANVPFRINPHFYDGPCGTMTHKDFDGNRLFMHLAGRKLRLHGRPFFNHEAYPHVQEVMKISHSLKQKKLI